MLFGDIQCRETVSVFEAVMFGAGDACVDIGMGSLLGGVALFIAAVVLLRFLGARLVRAVLTKRAVKADESHEDGLTPMPYESPIKSTGAWGSDLV